MNKDRVASLIRELLIELGENPDRDGLLKTPERVAKAYEFLTTGYRADLKTIINEAIFSTSNNNMVICRNIEIYSLCEHHMLPFYGKCHIGYLAENKVIGVSKLARIVDYYARRLQIQERLSSEIAQAVMDITQSKGVGVMMDCQHMCMMMRGVEKQNSSMLTSALLGLFRDKADTRAEFLGLIKE